MGSGWHRAGVVSCHGHLAALVNSPDGVCMFPDGVAGLSRAAWRPLTVNASWLVTFEPWFLLCEAARHHSKFRGRRVWLGTSPWSWTGGGGLDLLPVQDGGGVGLDLLPVKDDGGGGARPPTRRGWGVGGGLDLLPVEDGGGAGVKGEWQGPSQFSNNDRYLKRENKVYSLSGGQPSLSTVWRTVKSIHCLEDIQVYPLSGGQSNLSTVWKTVKPIHCLEDSQTYSLSGGQPSLSTVWRTVKSIHCLEDIQVYPLSGGQSNLSTVWKTVKPIHCLEDSQTYSLSGGQPSLFNVWRTVRSEETLPGGVSVPGGDVAWRCVSAWRRRCLEVCQCLEETLPGGVSVPGGDVAWRCVSAWRRRCLEVCQCLEETLPPLPCQVLSEDPVPCSSRHGLSSSTDRRHLFANFTGGDPSFLALSIKQDN